MNNNILNISGTIGFIIMENKNYNKIVYIFFDDHSNKKYCKDNGIFINELFEKLDKTNKNIVFLMEEPLINSKSKLQGLWNDSKHIVKSKNFYYKFLSKCSNQKICNVFPIDIRLCLFNISLDELIENINNPKYFSDVNHDVYTYFKNLLYIFELVNLDEILNNHTNENIENIIFLKKVFDIFYKTDYYQKIKKNLIVLYKSYILPNKNNNLHDFLIKNTLFEYNFTEGYPFVNSGKINFLDLTDKILNSILEFYTVILTNYINYEIIVINTGFFHGLNIKYILENIYNYKIVDRYGVSEFKNIERDTHTNCIVVDKNVFKL